MKVEVANIVNNRLNTGEQISIKRLFIFITLCILVLVPVSIFMLTNTIKYQSAVYFLILLTLAIAGFFILNKRLVLFEPIVLFSTYYTTVLIAGIYSIYTDYNSNDFVNNTCFKNDIHILTTYACMYFFFGYICMLIGYYLVKRNNLQIKFDLETKEEISDRVLNLFILCFLVIGISNFLYNVWILAGGNLFTYLANVSVRQLEFADSGTASGYLLAYNAMFIWLFKLFRNRNHSKLFIIMLLITIIMKASTGRIFGTMLYIASFVGIYYLLEISNKKKINNAKYYFAAIGLVSFGIIFYFMRIISSIVYNNSLKNNIGLVFMQLFNQFGYYAVDKGNMPNIGVVLKIIDSWGTDIGYLYGQSLVTWICNILPSSMRFQGYQPSVMIKQTWYLHIIGGNLPPTGIGEMYANFGIFGPFLGMFLFGCLAAYLYNYTIKSRNYWCLAIYVQITIGFIMLYPKGEFDNLTLLYVLPILIVIVTMKVMSKIKVYINNINTSNSKFK
ncbi:MAG: O-antigen polymerase [Syntrophomonas sp.]